MSYPEFQDLIQEEYFLFDIQELVLTQNLDSENVKDQLKARQIFKKWLSDIIEEAKVLLSEQKGE